MFGSRFGTRIASKFRKDRPPQAAENPLNSSAGSPSIVEQRRALIARYMQQYIETAIAIPDVLQQDRKDVRKHWADRGNKAPVIGKDGKPEFDAHGRVKTFDIDKGQIDYDVGTILAQRARHFANGLVDQIHPMPSGGTPAASVADAPKVDGEDELAPHVGSLDPAPAPAETPAPVQAQAAA